MGLNLYKKDKDKDAVSHLLRRTIYGANFSQISEAQNLGIKLTVNKLLESPKLSEPLSFLPEETMVGEGESWVKSYYPSDEKLKGYHENARRDSLVAWLLKKINYSSLSVHEKMCLFWHNHFAAINTDDSRATFNYYNIIQKNALGNFKTIVQEVAIDPCMLKFLNGNESTFEHPNENFARELLELFTIGKGEQVAPGDYSNYTEKDVQEGARIFTGWKVKGFLSNKELPYATFEKNHHDQDVKTLSHRFNNRKIKNGDEKEYLTYIDIIFEKEETAKFICRKLYRWFVNWEIDSGIEKKIISKLAKILRENNFEIKPVLENLFLCEHFYDEKFRGAIIKNPIEFLFSMLNPTLTQEKYPINTSYNIFMNCNNQLNLLGMNYCSPPSVSGWPAYYQAPNYYKLWVNASFIKTRFDLIELFTLNGGIVVDDQHFEIDSLRYIDSLSKPNDVNQVIEDTIKLFFPKGLSDDKKNTLKKELLNDLPDYEWRVEYYSYSKNKFKDEYTEPIRKRVANMLEKAFKFPEFQLI